jgi:hypothetical protein
VAFKTAVEIIYKLAIILVGFWKIFIFSGHALDQAGSGYGLVAGTYECSNEPSSSVKCRGFLD